MPEEKIEKNINNFENQGKALEKPSHGDSKFEKIDLTNIENPIKQGPKKSVFSERSAEVKVGPVPQLSQSANKEREKQIENILEIDLAEIYLRLSPENKRKFKVKGEETASAINRLLDGSKIKIKKILALIKDWLKLIPGVNKFFMEQLAKNKLDEIMKLKNK